MKIPLLDLKRQYLAIKDEIKAAIEEVLVSQQFILGPKVEKLEKEIADYCRVNYALGVSSGTDALLVSLMALEIGPGDSIITSSYSFFATAGVIVRVGARPVFIDINPLTYNLDPEKLKGLLKKGKRYQAIIPVHLFGQCAEMEPIIELAKEYRLKIVEDAAQAIGAKYQDKWAGSMGEIGCFSFFPSKNLGGYGDGGIVVTDNLKLAERLRILRVHGASPKYYHSFIGGNFRLDALQAVVILVKLRYLNEWTKRRQEKAASYKKLFEEKKLMAIVKLPYIQPGNFHVFNQYVIRVPERDRLKGFLTKQEIGTEVYYPVPLSLQKCLSYLGYKAGDFPESERAAKEILALPIYPELSEEEQKFIVDKIGEFLRKSY